MKVSIEIEVPKTCTDCPFFQPKDVHTACGYSDLEVTCGLSFVRDEPSDISTFDYCSGVPIYCPITNPNYWSDEE